MSKKPVRMEEYTVADLEVGCVVVDPGNAAAYRTGDWRSRRPVVDAAACIRCAVCWTYCPDAAIRQAADGHFEADLDYCKGCGICAKECWSGCITMIGEEE